MEERIRKAEHGRELWISMTERFQINPSMYIIVLPTMNKKENAMAIKFLPVFLKRKRVKKCIVLTCDTLTFINREKLGDEIEVEKLSQEEINDLLQFYCLYEFTSNLIVASLEQPSGRLGKNMVKKKGFTEEEIFAGVVYGVL